MKSVNENIEVNIQLEELSSKLEIFKMQKEELITQIDGEKNFLKQTEKDLEELDKQIIDLKTKINEDQTKFINVQEKGLRDDILMLGGIPALAIGGLVITLGGVSASILSIASTVGSYFIISNNLYRKNIKKVKLNGENNYRSTSEYLSLSNQLDELLKQRQILDEKMYEIKYDINCYNNQLNVLISQIIYLKNKIKEVSNGLFANESLNMDTLDVSVVRSLR